MAGPRAFTFGFESQLVLDVLPFCQLIEAFIGYNRVVEENVTIISSRANEAKTFVSDNLLDFAAFHAVNSVVV
jgi:hypothetical protein